MVISNSPMKYTIHIYTHTHIHIQICTYIHIHIHTPIQVFFFKLNNKTLLQLSTRHFSLHLELFLIVVVGLRYCKVFLKALVSPLLANLSLIVLCEAELNKTLHQHYVLSLQSHTVSSILPMHLPLPTDCHHVITQTMCVQGHINNIVLLLYYPPQGEKDTFVYDFTSRRYSEPTSIFLTKYMAA